MVTNNARRTADPTFEQSGDWIPFSSEIKPHLIYPTLYREGKCQTSLSKKKQKNPKNKKKWIYWPRKCGVYGVAHLIDGSKLKYYFQVIFFSLSEAIWNRLHKIPQVMPVRLLPPPCWAETVSGSKTNALFGVRGAHQESRAVFPPSQPNLSCGLNVRMPEQRSICRTHHHRPLLFTAPARDSEDTRRMQAAFTPSSSATLLILASLETDSKQNLITAFACTCSWIWLQPMHVETHLSTVRWEELRDAAALIDSKGSGEETGCWVMWSVPAGCCCCCCPLTVSLSVVFGEAHWTRGTVWKTWSPRWLMGNTFFCYWALQGE